MHLYFQVAKFEEPQKRNFGFGYAMDGLENATLSEGMMCFGLSHAGRAVDSCQLAYLKFEMRSK